MRDRPSDIDEALAKLEQDQSERLWICYSDYNGRTQAKSVEPASFAIALRKGLNFARANLEFNLLNQMTDGARFTADTGDFYATPDLSTICSVPYHPGASRATAWMRDESGNDWEGCPRFALKRQIDALADAGIELQVAFEPEAFLFRRDGEGAIVPADRAGMYSLDRLEIHADFFAEVAASLGQMGIKVEQVGAEYGTGQVEINIGHAAPLKAADDLVVFRDVFKAIARKHGLIGSFMPKPFESGAGSGLHIHLSLWSSDGDDLMADHSAPDGISPTGKSFIAGLLAHAPALTGLGAPTVNSYKRLLPGSWAPAHAAWGIGDRGVLIRVPSATKPRIEVRCGDNTAQPYLFLAGILAAGLDGVTRSLTPIPASTGYIGHFSRDAAIAAGHQFLPRVVHEALDAVEQDALMRVALGDVIHGEWLKVKRSEAAAHAIVVTEWERDLYLEF